MKTLFLFATFAFVLSLAGVFGLGLGERRDYRSRPQYDQRRDQQWGQQQRSEQRELDRQHHGDQIRLIVR
jgi:hypothetical protein